MSLSIVTVTHKSGRHAPRYVESFLASGSGNQGAEIEFIIVENSADREIGRAFDPLRQAGHRVRLIKAENRGFGHACNIGAAAAQGATLIFANPDLEFIDPIDPIDNAGPNIWGTVRQLGTNGIEHAFDVLEEHKSFLGSLRTAYRGMTPDNPNYADKIFPSGAFFIVGRKIFTEVGGFDERFFMYYEEAELSRRILKRGLLPRYFWQIRVRHEAFGSATNAASTIRHETRGLLTYVAVTGRLKVLINRYLVLALLSPLSPTARQRLVQLVKSHATLWREKRRHGE